MPDKKEKKLASPSPKFEDELARHWAAAEINMPNETSKARVRSMGARESAILGNPFAMTYPNNTIAVNLDKVDEDNPIRGTLVHELTHVGQKSRGLGQFMKDRFTPWHKRPNEIEAVNKEATYPWREKGKDIQLRYPDPEKQEFKKKQIKHQKKVGPNNSSPMKSKLIKMYEKKSFPLTPMLEK